MPGGCAKMPRGLRSVWPLMAVVCLAVVSVSSADITSNETPLDVLVDEEERNDVSIEELRAAIVDELFDDLVEQVFRIYRERQAVYNGLSNIPSDFRESVEAVPAKKAGGGRFLGAGQMTNIASGFHKKSAADQYLWDAYQEDKRGRATFNDRLTNLNSGFTKKSDGEGEVLEEGEGVNKRGRAAFNTRLTNLASGFSKRTREDKRGHTSFMGASRMTNLRSGFNKRREGNFNVGPMVHIPSGFAEKRAES